MQLSRTLIAPAVIAIAALAGCASTGSTGAAGGAPASAPVSSAPAAAATIQATCTKACVASGAQASLIGLVAQDDSVITKAKCKSSTVKHPSSDTYTVTCTATYSDGSVAKGIASLLVSQNKVAWEPTDIISDGSGG